MAIKMIACTTESGYIGLDGDLIYKLKKDLQRFKSLTEHNLTLMGKSTWISLPRKPLPRRVNIVLTNDKKYKVPQGVFLAHSKEQILNHYLETGKNTEDKDLFIIGGERLYQDWLEHTDEIYLTRVKDITTVGDTKFPLSAMEKFFNLVEGEVEYHEENGVKFTFEKWIRNNIKDLS